MMTHNVTPAGAQLEGRRRFAGGRKAACLGALGLAFSLALSGCTESQPDGTYIEGWWDNGDAFYAPSKTALFDENGVPTCEFPVQYNQFESRSSSVNLARGVAFEIMNPETPVDAYMDPKKFPTEEDQAKERLRRERALGSLDVLWEYTHPLFDAENGINTPADLEPIKDKLQAHLFGLGKEGMFVDYLEVSEVYFVSESGRYSIKRLGFVEDYFKENGIPLKFEGIYNEYYTATLGDTEYVLVLEKETGNTTLWLGDQQSEVGDAIWYATVEVRTALTTGFTPPPVMAEFLLQSDGCPEVGGHSYQRYYLRSIILLDPATEEVVEPSPEPSPSL